MGTLTLGRVGGRSLFRSQSSPEALARTSAGLGEQPSAPPVGSSAQGGGAGPATVASSEPSKRRRRFPRIGTVSKLAGFHALVVASVLAIVALQLTMEFSSRYRATITRDLYENVAVFDRAAVTRPSSQSLPSFARSYLAGHGQAGGDQLAIALPSYHTTLGSPGLAALLAVPSVRSLSSTPAATTTIQTVTVSGTSVLLLAVPIVAHNKAVGTFSRPAVSPTTTPCSAE